MQISIDESVLFFIALASISYLTLLVVVAIFRSLLWQLSSVFWLIDELMWFLYNPFRWTMRVGYEGRSYRIYRRTYLLLTYTLIAPAYKVLVYIVTTPLRLLTSLYFDVLMYVFVSTADSIDELFHPKLGAMRFKKGFSYYWRWLVFFPYRLLWFVFRNLTTIIDSIFMVTLSIAWPTFTMFHGTSQDAVVNISRAGRWYVGPGNFAGSGIYFGRSVKTAKLYAGTKALTDANGHTVYPIIIARVTLSMLRNTTTLPDKTRQKFGKMGSEGAELSKEMAFPFFSTELWRTHTNWWEYCLLQGGKDGQFVRSWRIRPVGYVHVTDKGHYSGALQRLWGGKSSYALRPENVAMAAISALMVVGIFTIYSLFL